MSSGKIKEILLKQNISHTFNHPLRYHEDKMVNFNLQDGYSVLTMSKPSPSSLLPNQDDDLDLDKNPPLLDSDNLLQSNDEMNNEMPTASSILLVHGVQFKHGGNYTCAPSNTRPTNINVHVLKGKYTRTRLKFDSWSQSDY